MATTLLKAVPSTNPLPNNRFTQVPADGHPRAVKVPSTKKPKAKQKLKVYVLDTNVLIDDPDAINQFVNNFVVIPITVVRELDNKKGQLFSARHALKALEASGANGEWRNLDSGGQIKIELVTEASSQLNDDVIISVAKDYKSKGFGDVVFVTNDRAAAIKARALGIVTESYRTNEVDMSLFEKQKSSTTLISLTLEQRKTVYENGYVKPYVPEYWKQKGERHNLGQERAINSLFNPEITFLALIGQAGTGKTMLAILAALKMVTIDHRYEKIIVTKPVVAVGGNDIGFLPGSKEEKMGTWIAPIRDQVDSFFRSQSSKKECSSSKKITAGKNQKERSSFEEYQEHTRNSDRVIFDSLVSAGTIEIEAEAFIRGRSFENAIVIIDEGQNFSASAAKVWMTRMGDNSKLIMTGDVTQIDTPYLSANNNALSHSAVKTYGQPWADTVFLELGVRSVMSDWAANNL